MILPTTKLLLLILLHKEKTLSLDSIFPVKGVGENCRWGQLFITTTFYVSKIISSYWWSSIKKIVNLFYKKSDLQNQRSDDVTLLLEDEDWRISSLLVTMASLVRVPWCSRRRWVVGICWMPLKNIKGCFFLPEQRPVHQPNLQQFDCNVPF